MVVTLYRSTWAWKLAYLQPLRTVLPSIVWKVHQTYYPPSMYMVVTLCTWAWTPGYRSAYPAYMTWVNGPLELSSALSGVYVLCLLLSPGSHSAGGFMRICQVIHWLLTHYLTPITIFQCLKIIFWETAINPFKPEAYTKCGTCGISRLQNNVLRKTLVKVIVSTRSNPNAADD